MKTLARLLVVALLAVLAPVALQAQPAQARGVGSQPLDDIRFWADHKKACGLSRDQLAAMMLAVTYPETGATGELAPSPMTLSRYDTQSRLYAFGDRNTPWQKAFWHPGAGMWQFDSAGGWNLSVAGAINTFTAAEQAASVMASRWCANPSRAYVWAPWVACATSSVCESIYQQLFDGSSLRNLTLHPGVTREGGMQGRLCTINGMALLCSYVDPSRAQGANWWTAPNAGASPITAPFYVVTIGGQEIRYWLAQDTGFLASIKAEKPITANARTSLQWSTTSELCDVTANRGHCGGGSRTANTPWGPRQANPFGSFDSAAASVGSIDVSGWTIDPDTNDPIDVHVYVDGTIAGAFRADRSRPDVAAAVPGYGDRHGFSARVGRIGGGSHQVCVYAINVGPAGTDNPQLGCRTVVVDPNPTGSFDNWVTSSPGIRVNGWALDPDTTAQIGVHVYVDGRFVGEGRADRSRPDVGQVFPWAGANRGWEIEVPAMPGPHTVCAYGLNVGPGGNRLLGCKSIVVPDRAPFGSFDSALRVSAGAARLRGWTIDPDQVFPIDVHVYVNGTFVVAVPAGVERPDVGAAFGFYGPYHGFDLTVAAPAGAQVCVYGINVGPGWGNPLLGCRSVP